MVVDWVSLSPNNSSFPKSVYGVPIFSESLLGARVAARFTFLFLIHPAAKPDMI